MESRDDLWVELADEARDFAPRLFAVFGFYGHSASDHDGFLSWGLELAEPRRAILWSPDGTVWHSESADRVLRSHQIGSTARLLWLD